MRRGTWPHYIHSLLKHHSLRHEYMLHITNSFSVPFFLCSVYYPPVASVTIAYPNEAFKVRTVPTRHLNPISSVTHDTYGLLPAQYNTLCLALYRLPERPYQRIRPSHPKENESQNIRLVARRQDISWIILFLMQHTSAALHIPRASHITLPHILCARLHPCRHHLVVITLPRPCPRGLHYAPELHRRGPGP
jgi:hypothetical protein